MDTGRYAANSRFLVVRLIVGTALLCITITGCGSKSAGQPVFKLGVIPFDKVDRIKTQYGPFANFIGRKCGFAKSEVFVTPEYAGVLQALKSDQIDCAYLNPMSYVLAAQEFRDSPQHLVPIAIPSVYHKLTYRGIVFVRTDSGITNIAGLRGRSFAFGDRTSTSGYLYPASMMKQVGIDPNADVKGVNMSGPATVLAVFNRQADGGAYFEGGIELALNKPSDQKQLRVIARTDPLPNGMMVARGDLPPAELAALRKAFVDVNTDPVGRASLRDYQCDKWVPANDHFFDSVRQKALILGLHLYSLDGKPK